MGPGRFGALSCQTDSPTAKDRGGPVEHGHATAATRHSPLATRQPLPASQIVLISRQDGGFEHFDVGW